jgi:integrase/recombinase XerD
MLARFLKLEDPIHEVPSRELYKHQYARPLPYIYSEDEIAKLLIGAGKLRPQPCTNPIRPEVFVMLLGLIASTGMRISEALKLRTSDIGHDGTLHIRQTKFGKSRYVPIHASVAVKLQDYLGVRKRVTAPDHDFFFTGMNGRRLTERTTEWTFSKILKSTGIGEARQRKPRIHDLRHTFATRALERCPSDRKLITKHFVALSTYLGHVDIKSTYWYLEATPELMGQLAVQAEEFIASRGAQ